MGQPEDRTDTGEMIPAHEVLVSSINHKIKHSLSECLAPRHVNDLITFACRSSNGDIIFNSSLNEAVVVINETDTEVFSPAYMDCVQWMKC